MRPQTLVRRDPDTLTPEQLHVTDDKVVVLEVPEGEAAAFEVPARDEITERSGTALVHVLAVDRAQHLVLPADDNEDFGSGQDTVQPLGVLGAAPVTIPEGPADPFVGKQERPSRQPFQLPQRGMEGAGEKQLVASCRQIRP